MWRTSREEEKEIERYIALRDEVFSWDWVAPSRDQILPSSDEGLEFLNGPNGRANEKYARLGLQYLENMFEREGLNADQTN